MNRLRLPHPGGDLDYINITACLLLVLYNCINLVNKQANISQYFLDLSIFILYPIINILFRSNKISFLMYFVVGFLTLLLNLETEDTSGLIYMFFAYNELKERRAYLYIAGSSFIALSFRFLLLGTNGINALVAILLFIFIFATFYFKVINQPKQIKNIDILKKEEQDIVKLYCDGYSYENISKKLSLNILPSTVRRKITGIKDLNGINNDAQFGKWLHELV